MSHSLLAHLATLTPNIQELEEILTHIHQTGDYVGLANALAQTIRHGVLRLALDNIIKVDPNDRLGDIAQEVAIRLAATLHSHTMLSLDYSTLMNCQTARQLREQIIRIEKIYIEEFRYVAEVSNCVAKNDWIIIKGLSVAVHYPDPSLRDKWDIDLYIKDFVIAMEIAAKLLASGSKFDDMSVKQIGKMSYGWKLHLFTPQGVPIEFHIGPLQAYAGGILEADFINRIENISFNDSSISIPSSEDQLLYVVAHAYRDGFIKFKDINDAYILTNIANFDSSYVQRCAEKSFLKPVLYELLINVEKFYPCTQVTVLQQQLNTGIIDCYVGRLFGINSTKSSHSFQSLSFPAHALYLASHCQRYGLQRSLRDVGRRIKFGLEHQFFPERDARRDSVSVWLSRLHGILFPFRPFIITSFSTGYFQLVFAVDLKAAQLSWQEVQQKLQSTSVIHDWTIEQFADQLYLWRAPNYPTLLFTPLGYMIPLTYFKTLKNKHLGLECTVKELWEYFITLFDIDDN